MRTAPATHADLLYVFKRLSRRNRIEHDQMGVSPMEVLFEANGWLNSHGATTAWVDEEPVFVFGVVPSRDGAITWFLATEAYFALGPASVRQGRRFVQDAFKKHGTLHTISFATHPDTERWFRALGFVKSENGDGYSVYTYR